MKRKLISLIVLSILLFINYNVYAQEITIPADVLLHNQTIEPSIYIGLNGSNFIGETEILGGKINSISGLNLENTYRITGSIGLFLSVNATSWMSFRTGCLYLPIGMKYKGQFEANGTDYIVNYILDLKYMQIPALVEFSYDWNVIKNNKYNGYKLTFNGGIAPGFLVGSKIKTAVWQADKDKSDADEKSEDFNEVNKFDLGFIIGAGFRINDGYIGLQYERGTKTVSSTGLNLKNQFLSIVLGLYLVKK